MSKKNVENIPYNPHSTFEGSKIWKLSQNPKIVLFLRKSKMLHSKQKAFNLVLDPILLPW